MPPFPTISELPELPASGTVGDDFNDQMLAYLTGERALPGEMNALSEAYADYLNSVLTATSSTSLAIGTGSKAFTIGTGYAFAAGQRVRAASAANVANYMEGQVASYTGGELTVTVDVTGGSGTKTDWVIGLVVSAGVTAFMSTLLDDADADTARATLVAAKSGANTDITALDQDVTITATGTIAANSLGFRGLPTTGQSQGSGITLALDDAGKAVPNTTGGWTIPANASVAFPIGTTIVLVNNSGSSQNCAITSDTLRQAGTANTGTRAIAQYGVATIYKVASTTWIISGAGVS